MAILAVDNFNRANAETPGANWTQGTTIPARHGILSNGLKVATVDTYAVDFYSALTWPDDQYSEARISTVASLGIQSVDVRINLTGSYQGYLGGLAEGNNLLRIGKWFGGSFSTLAVSAINAAVGQLWRFEAYGTLLRFYLDDVELLSATDTSMASGAPGFFTYHSSTAVVLYDDWEGGGFEPSQGRAIVGAAVNMLSSDLSTIITFNLSISQADATYNTTVDVVVADSDTQTEIRSKLITAVQAKSLADYGYTLNAQDIIAPDFKVGA